jgi:hypothetical protein
MSVAAAAAVLLLAVVLVAVVLLAVLVVVAPVEVFDELLQATSTIATPAKALNSPIRR